MHFTFTGDSFRAMSRTLGDRQLVGWYHTHLFQTERTIGLSAPTSTCTGTPSGAPGRWPP